MAQAAGPTAALAGVPTGLQSQGVWVGRRQLFVRFAAEAETATMYTAQAIAQELQRAAKRSAFHSISVGGRDPLANVDFLAAAFKAGPLPLPVMLDIDGQLLRIVEQSHAASAKTVVVIHPPYNTPIDRDRRWVTLIERSAALHPDVRLSLRLPPPTGTR